MIRLLGGWPALLRAGICLGVFLALAALPAQAGPPRKVTLHLKWSHQFQFAGYYAAQAKGYYREAGLEVALLEAGPGRLPIPAVERGDAEFGVSDTEVFQAYLEGRPLVALGVVFQHSPNVILSLRSKGILRPADLAGRKVMFQGGQGLAETRAMLESEGLRIDAIRQVPHSWNLDDLVSGRVDAIQAYTTNEPHQLQRLGAEVAQLRPVEYGIDFYGDILFTTKAFAAANPDVTDAFARASFRGWDYAMEHPEEVIDLILALPGPTARRLDRAKLRFEAEQMKGLVMPGLVDAGHMNPGRFRRIAETLVKIGQVRIATDPEGFLFVWPQPPSQAWLRALKWGLPATAALALLVALWITQLRRTVFARTRALLKEVQQRKRTEQALRESEARFRALFEGAPDAIILAEPSSGLLVDANPSACRLLGRSHEEIVGLHQHQLHPPQDDAFSRKSFEAHVAQSQSDGITRPVANQVLRPDGTLVPVEVLAQLIQVQDQALLMGTFRDITERRRAEEALRESEGRFRGLLQAVDAVAVQGYGRDGTTQYWNRASERLYGYTEEEALGRNLLDLIIPEEMRAEVVQAIQLMWETGQAIPSSELSLRRKDGSRVAVYSSHAVVQVAGRQPELFCIDIDLTDRKRLEAQLQQSQKMESLGSLAGGVAHDMNNVLGAILGMASLHEAQAAPGSALQRGFETITRAAQRGGQLVSGLLNFARQSPSEEQELDLNALLREEVRLLERTTLARIRLELDLAADLRPMRGDSGALIHAFMNLCVNSVDAMQDAGTLTLRTRNCEDGRIEVRVEDTGCGMDPETIEKAFDPFFTTKEQGKGTGLGLAMVYGTVKAHRGEIDLQSRPGQGTQVRIRFPSSRGGLPSGAASPADRSGGAPKALQVLLVDDDELIQASVLAVLESLGHSAAAASSGEQALELLQHGPVPDVVVLDMNMPGLGGAGTLPRLRALCPDLPVLLATGRADQTAHGLVAAHRHVSLLAKPFSRDALQAQLDQLGGA